MNNQVDGFWIPSYGYYNIAFRGYDAKYIINGCRLHNGCITSPYAFMLEEE